MQAVNVRGELGAVGGLGGGPVAQRGLGCLAVSQAVGDGEAGVSFQLGKHHQHLPAGGDRECWRKRNMEQLQFKAFLLASVKADKAHVEL